jgi:para-nitrobenzyl esterase
MARPPRPRRAMADIFIGYIAAFAKTGYPNPDGLPSWPRYPAEKSKLIMFTPDAAAIVQADPWKSRLDPIERGRGPRGTAAVVAVLQRPLR